MSKGISTGTLKGAPNSTTLEGMRAIQRKNNKLDQYGPDGRPSDAFCKPGEYDVKDGKHFKTTPGKTRWS